MTYFYCKTIITNSNYTSQVQKDDMQMKLDVFLLNDRITQAQYTELSEMLAAKPITA